jgi:hypothetical protein
MSLPGAQQPSFALQPPLLKRSPSELSHQEALLNTLGSTLMAGQLASPQGPHKAGSGPGADGEGGIARRVRHLRMGSPLMRHHRCPMPCCVQFTRQVNRMAGWD